MRVLMAVAALLLATSAAQAQYTFEYEGRTIRIDPDRGTVSIPGVFDNTPKKSKRARTDQGNDHARQQTRPDPHTADQTAPATSQQATAPANPAPATSAAPANNAPAETAAIPPAPAAAPQAPPSVSVQQNPTPAAAAAPLPAPTTTAVAPPPAPAPKSADNFATAAPPSPLPPAPAQRSQPQAAAPAAVHDSNSPVGVWLTEEKEGQVRIEPCGANLCGYSVDAKSNQNAEQVLINMKLGKDQKWSGRILDPNTGSTYDSTIALIGGNALRVQGCAFGGMFCGGQTWTRVN
jgi:uncharacterized protein (DUF2147 family)